MGEEKKSGKLERLAQLRAKVKEKYRLYYKDNRILERLVDTEKKANKSNKFVQELVKVQKRFFDGNHPKEDSCIKLLFRVDDDTLSETIIGRFEDFCDEVDRIHAIRKIRDGAVKKYEAYRSASNAEEISVKHRPIEYISGLIGHIDKHTTSYDARFKEDLKLLLLEEYREHEVGQGSIETLEAYIQTEIRELEDVSDLSDKNKGIGNQLFDYTAVVDRFDMAVPVSLIKKLIQEEWEQIRLTVLRKNPPKELGMESFTGDDRVTYLRLTESGKQNADAIEFDDLLVLQILDYCDFRIDAERKLFNTICLKRRFFFEVFMEFDYHINLLIQSKNFPSKDKKGVLLRLLAIHYGENENYGQMHDTFTECISHIRIHRDRESTAFYMDWADYEKRFGHEDEAVRIYHQAIEDFPLPRNKNRSARFELTLHYYQNNEREKAIALWSENDYILLGSNENAQENDSFIERLYGFLGYLIGSGRQHEASILQRFFIVLKEHLERTGNKGMALNFIEALSERAANNYRFRIALIRSYLKLDLQKVEDEIKILSEEVEILDDSLALLYMDYYLECKEYDMAICYATNYLDKHKGHYPRLIKKLITSYQRKKHVDWQAIRSLCEKLEENDQNSFYKYAMALNKLGEDFSIVNQVYVNYFDSHPESCNTKAIGSYVTFCIKNNRRKFASKLILEKILQINSNEGYTDYFISFLYQQQIKLTSSPNHLEVLLDKALKHSADNPNQKAIIHSSYAKKLMYSGDGGDIGKTSKYNLNQAIEHFEISHKYKADNLVLTNMAYCLFHLARYRECIKLLNKIGHSKGYSKRTKLKLDSLYGLKAYSWIRIFTSSINGRFENLIGLGHYYQAMNKGSSIEERKDHFSKAVKLNGNTSIRLEQAVFLYPVDRSMSLRLLEELKNSLGEDEKERIRVQQSFLKKVNVKKAYPATIKKLRTTFEQLNKKTYSYLNGINNLLEKYPLDVRLYTIAFDYHLKFGLFKKCEDILEVLIEDNFVDKTTGRLFFKLAQNYYEFSQWFSYSGKVNRTEQITCLNKANRYIEYAVMPEIDIDKAVLHTMVAYKQGQLKKHRKIADRYSKMFEGRELERFVECLSQEKAKVKVFLWPVREDDYYDKLLFYRGQEKLAATIIGNGDQPDKSPAVKILKSILSDTEFNEQNKFFLLNRVRTRLAHYYYKVDVDLSEALRYQKKIYKSKYIDAPFIRAFLITIENVDGQNKKKDYIFGEQVCEYYLKFVKLPSIYRHYGNFLKELGKYEKAYLAYCSGLDIEKLDYMKCLFNNNIIILCHHSFVIENRPFKKPSEIKNIADDSFGEILEINPLYKRRKETLPLIKAISDKARFPK